MRFRLFYLKKAQKIKLIDCIFKNISIFVGMKKQVVWILSAVMCVSFVILLLLQVRYMKKMTTIRQQEFDKAVKTSLYSVAHQLEMDEAKRYLEEDIREMAERNSNFGNLPLDGFYSQTQTFSFQNGTFSFSQTIQPPMQAPGSSTQPQSPS